ncbi:uncharacterized protein LOC117648514 [Thrips palmi]|uniref:Uncharacterized protein LOC117648514 n=1 Tax=Thrips palmi TaxID=161013 RepID=A0A6P8ZCY2_THRPL|nr:uncharacterized protein LOC117648514 [Thrips palmi]
MRAACGRLLRPVIADLYVKSESDEEGPLTQHFQWWLRTLQINQLPGLKYAVLAWLRQGTGGMIISVFIMFHWSLESAISRKMFGLRIALAMISCIMMALMLRLRLNHLLVAITYLRDVSVVVESCGPPRARVRMARRARFCAKLVRFYEIYCWATELILMVVIAATKQSWHHTAAQAVVQQLYGYSDGQTQATLAETMRWCLYPFQVIGTTCSVVVGYSLISLIIVIYLCMSELYYSIGLVLEAHGCSALWARQQSALTMACLQLDAAIADFIPHLLICNVVLPLLYALEVVLHGAEADLFAMALAPLVLVVFVPFCLVGDAMCSARAGVVGQAYAGPWLEERGEGLQVRRGMMQSATGLGGVLRGRGVGPLDRKLCGTTMANWFKFLQTFLEFAGR